ncbi:MAG: radical SAM protein [Panacagrimonas sp.]
MTMAATTVAAKESLRAAGFGALADRADIFDAEIGISCRPIPPFLLDSPNQLVSLLVPLFDRPKSLAASISEAFSHLPERDRSEIEAVLLRATAPRAAMTTVPERTLFEIEESRCLPKPAGDSATIPAIDLRQLVGQPINYRGYLCVILKVTRLCNLRCIYCNDWSDQPKTTVSVDLMARLFAQALNGPRAGLDLVLHGGEPTMMGRRRFLQMLWLLSHYARLGQTVRVHMQSNGTLIDERWIRLLSLFDIQVSISLDGTDALHDRARPDVLGRPSATRAAAGMARLQNAGLLSGVLVVVTPATIELGAEALLMSLQSRGVKSVCLLAERPTARAPAVLRARDFAQFLAEFALARHRQPQPWIAVREIDAAERLLRQTPSGFCELAGNCVGHFVTVDADGSVSHCDKYVGDESYCLGNINNRTLDEILLGAKTNSVRQTAAAVSVPENSQCPHRHLCQGWCPHERYVSVNSDDINPACCGLAPLFETLSQIRSEGQSKVAGQARV